MLFESAEFCGREREREIERDEEVKHQRLQVEGNVQCKSSETGT